MKWTSKRIKPGDLLEVKQRYTDALGDESEALEVGDLILVMETDKTSAKVVVNGLTLRMFYNHLREISERLEP